MSDIELDSAKVLNRKIAKLPGVRNAVYEKAQELGERSLSVLRAHYHSGESSIEVDKGKIDSTVTLVSDGAVPLETGHMARDGSTWVEGVHAVSTAAAEMG